MTASYDTNWRLKVKFSNNVNHPVGVCSDSGKLVFKSRKDARAYSKNALPGERFSVYACGDHWHYGHKPYSVKRGMVARKGYNNRRPRDV